MNNKQKKQINLFKRFKVEYMHSKNSKKKFRAPLVILKSIYCCEKKIKF